MGTDEGGETFAAGVDGGSSGENESGAAPRKRVRRRRASREVDEAAPATPASTTDEGAGEAGAVRRRRRRKRTTTGGAVEVGDSTPAAAPSDAPADAGASATPARRRRRRRLAAADGSGTAARPASESGSDTSSPTASRGRGHERGGRARRSDRRRESGRDRPSGRDRHSGRDRASGRRPDGERERDQDRDGAREEERGRERRGGRRFRRGDEDAIEIVPRAPDPTAPPSDKVLLVNARDRDEARIALVVDGRLEEVFIELPGEKSAAGNVYRGRIQNVEKGIGAAFVDLGRGVTGFLHATDVPLSAHDDPATPPIERLRDGDEVIVQVTRDSIGRKGPALTGRISLPGRYLVLMPHAERSGISRRIPEGRERDRVRKLVRSLAVPEGMGVIVRTASETTDSAALEADLAHLLDEWAHIQRRAAEPGAPGVLRGESDIAERSVRDIMPPDVSRIVVDQPEIAAQIHRLLRVWYPSEAAAAAAVGAADARLATALGDAPHGEVVGQAEGSGAEEGESASEHLARLRVRARQMPVVEIHADPMPLFHAFNVEAQLEDAYRRSARLPSGGSIVIDPTEALVAIDVNSGRLTDEADPESTALVTNLEAVEEAARQLRLRDLGGIVVIDFIDMRMRSSRRQVEKALEVALSNDRARIRLGRMGPFGLVVLSRQRIRQALARATHDPCDACGGTGRRRSAGGTGLRIVREVQARIARSRGRGGLEIRAPADVVVWLKKHRAQEMHALARTCTGPLRLEVDDQLARDTWAMKGLPPRGETAAPAED